MIDALSTKEQGSILSLDKDTGLIFINKGQVDYTEAERLLYELPDIIKAAKVAERELLVNNIANLEKRLTYMRMRLEVLP